MSATDLAHDDDDDDDDDVDYDSLNQVCSIEKVGPMSKCLDSGLVGDERFSFPVLYASGRHLGFETDSSIS